MERIKSSTRTQGSASELKPVYPKADLRCRPLDRADSLGSGASSRIPDHRDTPSGAKFVQELDPLAGHAIVEKADTPVTFPPGLAREATSPAPIGSADDMMIGMVAAVAFFAATAPLVSGATITSGRALASSSAITASRSRSPAA